MSLEIWISFFIASAALLAIPGPTVMIVVSYALGQGRSSAWATVPGVASLLGAGAILAASATLFTALKIAGAVYLIWLGVKLWRSDDRMGSIHTAGRQSKVSMFRASYIVTALNPKGIVFFVAFVPQFVNVNEPVLGQFIILEATFLVLAALNVAIWAVLAGKLRERFKSPKSLKIVNRIGGSFLICAGMLTAVVRRTA